MYTLLGIIILYYCFKFISKKIKGIKPNPSGKEDYLEQLTHLLFKEGQTVILENIKQLKNTPAAFVQEHQRIYEPYGIEEAEEASSEVLLKILLAHHLGQRYNFVTLDWKQSGQNGIDSINWLLNNNGIPSIPITEKEGAKRAIHKKYVTPDSPYYLDTNDLLTYLAAILTKEGISLIELALGGDSYELFLLPNQQIPRFVELMNQLGFDFQIMR